MLFGTIIACVFAVQVYSQNATNLANGTAQSSRDKRTIGTILTNLGGVFGYDVFQRPRIVLTIPATIPVGLAPAPAPAPAPGPAPAPAGPAPAPAPAAPSPAPMSALTAPSLLTDNVRRQFSINLNWNRNKSPDQPQPVLAAYAAPVAAAPPVPAPPAAPVPPPAPAPPPPPPERPAPQPLPPQSGNKITLVDYDEEEEYEDRPKRFHIELADDETNIKLTQIRKIDGKRDGGNSQSKDKFKRDFNTFWEESPWTATHGYKYIVPQEAASTTLLKSNAPGEVPTQLSQLQEGSNTPKDAKVRSIKVTHNIKIVKKPQQTEDYLSAPATPFTYYEPIPANFKQEQTALYSTPKPINEILLKFYKKKFAIDAARAQQDADNAKAVVNSYPPDKVLPMQYENPLEYYSNPDVYPPLDGYILYEEDPSAENQQEQNEDKSNHSANQQEETESTGKEESSIGTPYAQGEHKVATPLEQEVKPELHPYAPGEYINLENRPFSEDYGDKIVIVDDYVEYNNENDPTKVDPHKSKYYDGSYDDYGKVSNYKEKENEEKEDEEGKNSKIVENNANEFLQVEYLNDKGESEEESKQQLKNESAEKQDTSEKEQEDQKEEEKEQKEEEKEEVEEQPFIPTPEDVDNFIKQHFSDKKQTDFDKIRDEIRSEYDYIHNQRDDEKEQQREDQKEESELVENKQDAENEEEEEQQKENEEEEQEQKENEEEKGTSEEESKQEVNESEVDENQEISQKEKDEREAEENAKIRELEKEHEKNFYNVFPNLGDRFVTFFKGDGDDDKQPYQEKEESKRAESKTPKNNKYINNFNFEDEYSKTKTDFANNKYFPSKTNLVAKTVSKQTFQDKDNYEDVEKSVVHPLYSGIWHIGNLQELYKAEKPLTVPFDHEYGASEQKENKKIHPRVRREIKDTEVIFSKEIKEYEKKRDMALGHSKDEQASENKEQIIKESVDENENNENENNEKENNENEKEESQSNNEEENVQEEESEASENEEQSKEEDSSERKIEPKASEDDPVEETIVKYKDGEQIFLDEIKQYEEERKNDPYARRTAQIIRELSQATQNLESYRKPEEKRQLNKKKRTKRDTLKNIYKDKDAEKIFLDEIKLYEEESRTDPYAVNTDKVVEELSEATENHENYKQEESSENRRSKRETEDDGGEIYGDKDAEKIFLDKIKYYEEESKDNPYAVEIDKVVEELSRANENHENYKQKGNSENKRNTRETEDDDGGEIYGNKDAERIFSDEIKLYEKEIRTDPYAVDTDKVIEELSEATENHENYKQEGSSENKRRNKRETEDDDGGEIYGNKDGEKIFLDEIKYYEEESKDNPYGVEIDKVVEELSQATENHENYKEKESSENKRNTRETEDDDGGEIYGTKDAEKIFSDEIKYYEEESKNDPYAWDTGKFIKALSQATVNDKNDQNSEEEKERYRRDTKSDEDVKKVNKLDELEEAPAELADFEETAGYVPDRYNSKFTYEVPEPRIPTKYQFKIYTNDDANISPKALVFNKVYGRKRALVTVTRPVTIIT